jgi:hypothetical protein
VTGVRWVDWLDLLVPYLVLPPVLLAIAAAGTARRSGWTAVLGAALFLQGRGLHLAARSIGAVRGDAAPIPLWQTVGQAIGYAGIALLVLALGRAVAFRATPPVARRLPRSERVVSVPRLLALSAVAMVLTHWLRLLPLGYAAPGATRWEDYVDLLTPYAVAGPALVVLARVGAGARSWVLAVVGAAVFTSGHALHLSANSISFASGAAQPAYFWDEQVGHHLWFAGLTLLLVVTVRAVKALPLPAGPWAEALAVLVGITWAANVVEGGAVPFGSALAIGLTAYGWRTRSRPTGRLLAIAFGLSLLLVGTYGVLQNGFPQPSELGWL